METLLIKPHHFMDIIKLHGAGLDAFVPDEKLGHDFYKVGNALLADKSRPLLLTTEGDSICQPCRQYRGRCRDALTHIPGFTEKDAYNKTLDSRILSLYGLKEGQVIKARALCRLFYEGRGKIPQVWLEEKPSLTQRRLELFTQGARKYLQGEA